MSWRSQLGVPVVVSDLGALPELAYDSSFVFEAGNPGALAETILRHIDDGFGREYARSYGTRRHASRGSVLLRRATEALPASSLRRAADRLPSTGCAWECSTCLR